MSMEDILKALMQSAGSQQPPQQSSSGADAMSQMLGGMLGGDQSQSSVGGDLLSQVVGGLLGGQQSSGSGGVGALLDGLRRILGGAPGTGQPLPLGGSGSTPSSNDPIMTLLQPVVNRLAAKLGISPQVATLLASIALHYLVQSSPSTPGASPLNLGSVMQNLASGKGVSPTALQQSGMVNDVMQATGMNEQQALKSLNTTFDVFGSQLAPVTKVSGTQGIKSARGVRSKATLRRRRG